MRKTEKQQQQRTFASVPFDLEQTVRFNQADLQTIELVAGPNPSAQVRD